MYTFDQLFAGLKPREFRQALTMLRNASIYAARASANSWEFAVEIRELKALGLTDNDLRFLVRLRLVHHASESEKPSPRGRQFRPDEELLFTPRTCFVLTAEGVNVDLSNPANRPDQVGRTHVVAVVPTWDVTRKVLVFRRQVVKHFKRPATNQETILSAFQEEGWPSRIDDPLAPQPELDAKRRLSDAIRFLNQNHLYSVLRFHGDGTGEGVQWESLTPDHKQVI